MFKITLLSLFSLVSILGTSDSDFEKSKIRGQIIYTNNCASCHLAQGQGMAGAFPPLAKSDYLVKTPAKAVRAIKYGLMGAITVNGTKYDSMMPEAGLTDAETADVMNYILNAWGNSNPKMMTEKMVADIKPE